ncbi:MAG: hypothetical protein EOO26_02430 [Comamonadaceae bacterium]|nr:MAG: hypothetical protein EOO26_02430 [Comamonadaceae bacterium]
MRSTRVLTCAAVALASSAAWAEMVPLTQQEFDEQIVDKTMHAVPVSDPNRKFIVNLEKGGRAVVSSSYNDVGRWRPVDVAGYCTVWNKQAPTERCNKVVRVDGKLATVDLATGTVTATIDMR